MTVSMASTEAWLESIEPETEVSGEAYDAMIALIGNPGLAALIGLMLGSRAAFYMQLSMVSLDSPSQVARASVLQGKVQGIDLLRETLLEQSRAVQAGQGAMEQPA